jgi:hydroxymethylbilane synthase
LRVETEVFKTTGDKILDSPLSKIGDKGLFTRDIEKAMTEGKVDAAVHSLKDVPTELPSGLVLGAITKREDIRDVFISHPDRAYKKLADVPAGGTIATGSLRRRSQLLHWRPDLNVVDLRGNLNTRLEKLQNSGWDGMILARAGIIRLGREKSITEVFPFDRMLPAVGQGALAIEVRGNDRTCLRYVKSLANEAATIGTRGERALLHRLEGGCQIPVGAYGRVEENEFVLDAMVGSLDGRKVVRGSIHGATERSETLGEELAQTLLDAGAEEILDAIRRATPAETPAA